MTEAELREGYRFYAELGRKWYVQFKEPDRNEGESAKDYVERCERERRRTSGDRQIRGIDSFVRQMLAKESEFVVYEALDKEDEEAA